MGTLLSCLHQLRSENEDLESRLGQLSARRDRLVAATSRLVTPFEASVELNSRPPPLSSMLAKLNSEPQESKRSNKEKKATKSREKDAGQKDTSTSKSQTARGASKSSKGGEFQREAAECYSDSSLDGLGCREVLSETNSLNSSPIDSIKNNKVTKKDKKKKSEELSKLFTQDSVTMQKQMELLVQPPLSNPSEPSQLVGDTQNPAAFIHQIMRQDQAEPRNAANPTRHNPADIISFLSSQSSIINGHRIIPNNGYVNRSTENVKPASSGSITGVNGNGSPKVRYYPTISLYFSLVLFVSL